MISLLIILYWGIGTSTTSTSAQQSRMVKNKIDNLMLSSSSVYIIIQSKKMSRHQNPIINRALPCDNRQPHQKQILSPICSCLLQYRQSQPGFSFSRENEKGTLFLWKGRKSISIKLNLVMNEKSKLRIDISVSQKAHWKCKIHYIKGITYHIICYVNRNQYLFIELFYYFIILKLSNNAILFTMLRVEHRKIF